MDPLVNLPQMCYNGKTNNREVFPMYDELTEVDVKKMREEID